MQTRQNLDRELPFNWQTAKETVDAFAHSCRVPCLLTSAKGEILYQQDLGQDLCKLCQATMKQGQHCEKVHLYGSYQAERFGGRYIYFCPAGMSWFSSPILLGGQIAGALVCGPLLIMELEDYIASAPALQQNMPKEELEELSDRLEFFLRREPAELNYMSALLLSAALYIGDSSRALLQNWESESQQQDIGGYLQQLKLEQQPPVYPIHKERALLQAITQGDQADARRLLNELLGHIFFATGGDFAMIRARSLELMALLSRAAAEGGADLEQVLALNQRFLKESDYLRTTDELTVWLTRVIERYTALVFDLVNIKHKDIIYKAINFMKRNYAGKLTLEETARHVGFSPTYFSKVFKDELGTTFNNYLGSLRIEYSKALLLTGDLPVGEVCAAVGFEDQSYFIKVFRKYTGVTPGKFRKKQGRLDAGKERAPAAPAREQKSG